jgi:hypothetical protein
MRRAGLRKDEEEFLHRNEHSIELQAVFLRHVFGASRPARIVPVLCGPIMDAVGERRDPLQAEPIAAFVAALLFFFPQLATFLPSVPQIFMDVDRDKVLKQARGGSPSQRRALHGGQHPA